MKKNYESPKAEKLEFNYTDAVVASDVPGPSNTGTHIEKYWVNWQCGCGWKHKQVSNC